MLISQYRQHFPSLLTLTIKRASRLKHKDRKMASDLENKRFVSTFCYLNGILVSTNEIVSYLSNFLTSLYQALVGLVNIFGQLKLEEVIYPSQDYVKRLCLGFPVAHWIGIAMLIIFCWNYFSINQKVHGKWGLRLSIFFVVFYMIGKTSVQTTVSDEKLLKYYLCIF